MIYSYYRNFEMRRNSKTDRDDNFVVFIVLDI